MELEDGSHPPGKAAIFILGITPRSGTNFLSDLLCLHPDCAAPAPIFEDHLTYHADLLIQYAKNVSQSWRPSWNISKDLQASLSSSLGNGLIEFLSLRVGDNRLVTKTPSVRNLQHFFTAFPGAHLLVLVRDGRDVVESMVRGFAVNPEWAMRRWAEAARTILHFQESNPNTNSKYLIVRYEDLVESLQAELRKILGFLGLNVETYDFESATHLPVRGSSTLRTPGEEPVHWEPIEKPTDFNPVQRWRQWDRPIHDRFNWIAGQYLAAFGYEQQPPVPHPMLYTVRNRLLDFFWIVGGAFRAMADTIK